MSNFSGVLRALISVGSDPDTDSSVQTRMAPSSPVARACLAATALPLMGRYADDDGPLDRTPTPVPQGNRRQRRAARAKR